MPRTFTTTMNDLVKYLYQETSYAETLHIENALDGDPALWQLYAELGKARQQFPRVLFHAPKAAIEKILAYSACTHCEEV